MEIVAKLNASVPADLRVLPHWVCWVENGKGKVPLNPRTGGKAKSNDPETWAPFDTACQYWKEHLSDGEALSGLHFALNGDGIIGIDLDDCRNPKNKSISKWAIEIIKRFRSYTEVSPSGKGIRIFIRGQLPRRGRRRGKIEVYGEGRFLSVTGRKITSHGAGDAIEDRTEELLAWHKEVFGSKSASTSEVNGLVLNDAPTIDETKLTQLLRRWKKARQVFEGSWKGYPSQSEADLALAGYAAKAGWSDQEICDLIVVTRQNAGAEHEKVLQYYSRTIAKAREGPDGQNRNSETGGAVPEGAQCASIRPMTIEEARRVFCQYLYLPDPTVVDVVLAVVAGNTLLQTDPLWLFLKGPPGSGKTEILNCLRELRHMTMFVSSLTPAALISGYVDPLTGQDPSLLPKLNGKTLVIKDFTTILGMNPVARDEIFGILRDVYDGHASKQFGTGFRQYESRFNLLAGVTSAIEKTWHRSQMGERFLTWAMDTDRMEQARWALDNANKESEMRKELANAAAGVLAGLPQQVPAIPPELEAKTLILADLLARLRTYVERDRNDVVHQAPEVEVPTRISKQLLRLGQCLALVRHRDAVGEEELILMRKVALDSVPSGRRVILNELLEIRTNKQTRAADYFASKYRISPTAARRHLEDLLLLGVATEIPRSGDPQKYYTLASCVWKEWQQLST